MLTQTRTSKSILNENAQKFRLKKLPSKSIRYECIYKNLLRDVRKVFTILFNSQTQYPIIKKKNPKTSYLKFLKDFITEIFQQSTLEFLNIDLETAAFFLGSFIYPKYMIKCLNEEGEDSKKLTPEQKASNQQRILDVYYFSYKFSLERLNVLINETPIMMLIIYYCHYTKL